MNNITIGIPTYRRDSELIQVLKKAKDAEIISNYGLIVIDDKPSESLGDIVRNEFPTVSFVKNERNIGFARSFIELLHKCPSPYLMISADDDFLIHSGISEAESYLDKNRCDLLSTQWLRNGNIHRGRRSVQQINYSEIRPATNHAPGLIFNVRSALRHATFFNELLDCENYAAKTYPQVVLAYLLFLEGGIINWHNSAPVEEGFAAASQFKDAKGNGYWSMTGRVQEYVGFAEFFRLCESKVTSPAGRELALQLAIFHEQEFYKLFESSALISTRDGGVSFRGGALFYNLKNPMKACVDLFGFVRRRQKAHKIAAKSQAVLR